MQDRTAWIESLRPPKNRVNPRLPFAFTSERERSAAGEVDAVSVIFLTNRECPYRCLMCDLWKNTIDDRVPEGAIPEQIDHALARLPAARHVKLYNSGNFFDAQAIPPSDWPAIADRVAPFQTTIVENHPRLCGPGCLRFRDLIGGELEVALGLETIHPLILQELNKGMTLADFDRAAAFLGENSIHLRAFVLLKPPYADEEEGIDWALRSVEHAFHVGARCASIIPTRGGNGALDAMAAAGQFAPPKLASLERALAAGIGLARGRVFVDLWDAARFAECRLCAAPRIERLEQMNHRQEVLAAVPCECGGSA